MSDSTDLPVPPWVIVAAGLTWLVLLPVSALPTEPDTFIVRVGVSIADGLMASAFGVLVAGLLVDRWQRAEKRRRRERANLAWLEQTRVVVPLFLAQSRDCLGDLAVAAYAPHRVLLGTDMDVGQGHLVSDALAPALGTPPGVASGPLQTASDQVHDIYGKLTRNAEARADILTHVHHGDPAPPAEHSDWLLDPKRLEAFLPAALAWSDAIGDDAATLIGLVQDFSGEFVSGFGERFDLDDRVPVSSRIREAALRIRLGALSLDRSAGMAQVDQEESPEHQRYQEARMAASLQNDLRAIVQGVARLVSALRDLEYDWRKRLPTGDPLQEAFDEYMKGGQKLMEGIRRQDWEFDRPGSVSRKARARAREIIERRSASAEVQDEGEEAPA